MTDTIRWGIIGLGNIARKFAQDLAFVPNAKLIAVASRSQHKADAFGKEFKATYCHDSYQAITENPEVDAIYIATPHTLHYENTLMCIEKGKAVLCEKPFAMNISQAQEMIQLAQDKGVFLMEALWTKFLPSFRKVQEVIQAGTIGKIQCIQADFGFKAPFDPQGRLFDKALGGGSLLDVGIYPLFLAIGLLGKPDEVKAVANFGETNVDTNCGMTLKYNNDAIAVLSSSIVANNSLEANIFGDQGRIKMSHPFFTPKTQLELIHNHIEAQAIPFSYEGGGYNYEALEVGECLRKGKLQSDIMSHQDTLLLMKMLDWVREEAGIFYE